MVLEALPHLPFHYRPFADGTFETNDYGVSVVVNDGVLGPSRVFAALVVMPTVLCFSLFHLASAVGIPRATKCIMGLSFIASGVHNIDNILRPTLYHTPEFIYRGELLFPMDVGVGFWHVVVALGYAAIQTHHPLFVLLHAVTTSFGLAHYAMAPFINFSLFAHATILFESAMGLLVARHFLSLSGPAPRKAQK
mmetsp:Transcript_14365/g.40798  ORF Transcript_14365/g.40798 Transcript_14365/m.40798 type:complete len:194 (-) Transcript_14365:48-629(-)